MIRSILPEDHAVSRSIAKYFAVTFVFCVALLLSGQTVAGQKVRLRSQITPNCTSVASDNLRYSDLFGDGNIAVLGTYGCRGAFIFDISNPDAPVLASWYNPGNTLYFLEAIVIGNRAYFGSGNNGGVHIVDVSNPYAPVLLGVVNSTTGGGHNSIHEMVVFNQGGSTFLLENFNSTGNKILKVINVTDPAAPVFVRNITPTDPQWVHAMVVKGNRMFTSGWGNSTAKGRTEIYDISNITTQAPALIGFVSDPSAVVTAGNSMHSAWPSEDGNYLYSARETSNGSGDLRVYNIVDPSNPLLVNSLTMTALGLNAVTPHNPVVMGNYLYVSWYQAGVQIFDISTPTEPKRVGQYDTYQAEFVEPAVNPQKQDKNTSDKRSSIADAEPWDLVCASENFQNLLPSTYDGNWSVYPFLGQNKVLAGDLKNGLLILDATGVSGLPKNVVSDFDGDKKTDLAVFRPSNGAWQIERSSDGFEAPVKNRTSPLGDDIVPGDYDGDGISELGTYKTSTSQWTVRKIRPTGSRFLINAMYGSPGDIPIAADYDADGKTDIAIWRPSNGTFQIWRSTLGVRTITWEEFDGPPFDVINIPKSSFDRPLVGDYDGDGKIDLAVWRASTGTFYIQKSSSSQVQTVILGQNGDKPVSADFDGNGVTDAVVYRPTNGTWYVRDPFTLANSSFVWGNPEDSPIPADYDGDGKADFTVFRPSTNQWLRINSSNGLTLDRVFGQPGDTPSPSSIQPN